MYIYVILYIKVIYNCLNKKENILLVVSPHCLCSLTSLAVWTWTQKPQQQAIRASLVVSPATQSDHHPRHPDPDPGLLTLDVVLLPGLAPQHEDGDAGGDAAQGQVQQPGLAQVLRRVVQLAAPAEQGEAAWRRKEENDEYPVSIMAYIVQCHPCSRRFHDSNLLTF